MEILGSFYSRATQSASFNVQYSKVYPRLLANQNFMRMYWLRNKTGDWSGKKDTVSIFSLVKARDEGARIATKRRESTRLRRLPAKFRQVTVTQAYRIRETKRGDFYVTVDETSRGRDLAYECLFVEIRRDAL